MSDGTKIEWTDATWNIITGCSVVSAGCKHCYAMKLAGTRLQHHPSRAGLTQMSAAGPVWNGEVRFNEQWLDQPMRWTKPRLIFVCAHGDLFHEAVPDEWLDRVFAVMADCPKHTFQVLTKRPARMLDYLRDIDLEDRLTDLWRGDDPYRQTWNVLLPLKNVWLGVSVEDQAAANERIPLLLQTPAAVRWISAEPLLEAVDLCHIELSGGTFDALRGGEVGVSTHVETWPAVDWVVPGGESGSKARSMVIEFAEDIVRQCQAAGVPVLMKQVGANPTNREGESHKISDRKGSIMEEWPEILRVREYPEARP